MKEKYINLKIKKILKNNNKKTIIDFFFFFIPRVWVQWPGGGWFVISLWSQLLKSQPVLCAP